MQLIILALFIAAVLIPGVEQRISAVIDDISGSLLKGPTKVVTNAWIEVAVIAAGLGIGIWLLETKIAHHMGQELAAPPVESIHVAQPPSFGSSAGFTASTRGGVGLSQEVSSQGSSGSGSRGVGEAGRSAAAKPSGKRVAAPSRGFGRVRRGEYHAIAARRP